MYLYVSIHCIQVRAAVAGDKQMSMRQLINTLQASKLSKELQAEFSAVVKRKLHVWSNVNYKPKHYTERLSTATKLCVS